MTVWNVVDLVDKDSALLRQLIHDIAVMDDFTTNVNWRAKCLERDLDDVDGANHTCAEAARFEQKNPLLIGRSLAMSAIGDRIKRSGSHTTIISICQEFTWVRTDQTHVFGYAFCCAWAFTFSDMVVSF